MLEQYQSFTKETAAVHTAVKTKNYCFSFPFGEQSSIVMVDTSWRLQRRQTQDVSSYHHRKVCKKIKVNIQLDKKAKLALIGKKKKKKNQFTLDNKEQEMDEEEKM